VKSPRLTCLIGPPSATLIQAEWRKIVKRSRRVVLTLMGSAALGAVSEAVEARPFYCGPGLTAVPGPDGRPYCRATYGGFGGTLHHFHGHGHGGHAHGHAGG
jgi:hypothetical protein